MSEVLLTRNDKIIISLDWKNLFDTIAKQNRELKDYDIRLLANNQFYDKYKFSPAIHGRIIANDAMKAYLATKV